MFVWEGILQEVVRREGKESGKPFFIAIIDGLEIPFFGYAKDKLDLVAKGDFVKAVVVESSRNGFPSVSGFHICKKEVSV